MKNDFSNLEAMKYSGRTVGVAMTPSGIVHTLYLLTGRSSSSQARKLEFLDGALRTVLAKEPLDEEEIKRIEGGGKIKNTDLIFYPAMIEHKGILLASNGVQIGPIYGEIQNQIYLKGSASKVNLNDVMKHAFRGQYIIQGEDGPINILTYEPDSPNYTPRVDVVVKDDEAILQIVQKGIDKRRVRLFYEHILRPGQGLFISTYEGGNENPLVSFKGKPLEVGINSDDLSEITRDMYEAISHGAKEGENFSVAVAVMTTPRFAEANNRRNHYQFINRWK